MGFFTKMVSLTVKSIQGNKGPTKIQAHRNRVVCAHYSVKGKNPKTGRRKTVYVVVESAAPMEEVQKKSGLLPPYEIEAYNCVDAPSDRQIAYAEKLGFAFPSDASSRDASIFLTRKENDRPLVQPPTPDTLIRYLIGKGIDVPAYAGVDEAGVLYFSGISRTEKSAFFCMRVFCGLKRKKYCLLEDATPQERELFSHFATMHETDGDFLRSLSHYSAADLPLNTCTSLKKLKAYDIAADFLKRMGAV